MSAFDNPATRIPLKEQPLWERETMPTWEEMAQENHKAAKRLIGAGYARSSISRAYYAAYCAAASKLPAGTPSGWRFPNPSHEKLPDFIYSAMGGLSSRDRVRDLLKSLRKARREADYVPRATISMQNAQIAVRDAGFILQETLGK